MAEARRCRHCDAAGHHAAGLCPACYHYRWRTGRDRPRTLTHPQVVPCAACGQPRGANSTRGLCRADYMAWRRRAQPPLAAWVAARQRWARAHGHALVYRLPEVAR
jgi:hypothetical protein